jgi:hypothetical protein
VGVFGMLWPAAAKPGEGVAAEAPPAHPGRLARPGIVAAVPSVPGGFPEGDMETPGLVREIIPAGPVEPGLPAGGLPTGPTPAGDAAPPVGDPVAPPAPPPAPPEPPPPPPPAANPVAAAAESNVAVIRGIISFRRIKFSNIASGVRTQFVLIGSQALAPSVGIPVCRWNQSRAFLLAFNKIQRTQR